MRCPSTLWPALGLMLSTSAACDGGADGASTVSDAGSRADATAGAGGDATRPLPGGAAADARRPGPDAGGPVGGDRADTSTGGDAMPGDAAATDVGPTGGTGGHAVTDAGPDAGPVPPAGACSGTYARPAEAAILGDDRLDEISGLAPSPTTPGVLWMHNDSGDIARLYAVAMDGRLLGIVYLTGVENVDFEDLAAGPCPAGEPGRCLWVADTGNNGGDRDVFVVYAVPEPAVDAVAGFEDVAADRIWRFPVRYPDAVRDSEAMALAPDASTFYLFEKVDGAPTHVYRHAGDLRDGVQTDLVPVATMPAPGFDVPLGRMVTGAAMHPSGRRLLLRVYTGSYEYRLPDGADWSALATLEPLRVAAGPLTEPQGEAISYDAAGTGIYTVSEDTDRTGRVPLHFYACVP
jgi:hypothetical protein